MSVATQVRLKVSLQNATAAALCAQLRTGEPLALHRRGGLQAMVILAEEGFEWLVERADRHARPLAEGTADSAEEAANAASLAMVDHAERRGAVVSGAVDAAFRRVAVVQQGPVNLALRRFLRRWGAEVEPCNAAEAADGSTLLRARTEVLIWVNPTSEEAAALAALPRQTGLCCLAFCQGDEDARVAEGAGLHGVLRAQDAQDAVDRAFQSAWEHYVLGDAAR